MLQVTQLVNGRAGMNGHEEPQPIMLQACAPWTVSGLSFVLISVIILKTYLTSSAIKTQPLLCCDNLPRNSLSIKLIYRFLTQGFSSLAQRDFPFTRRPAGYPGLRHAALYSTLSPQDSTEASREGGHPSAPPTTKSHHLGGPRSPGKAASGAGQVSFWVSVYWEWGAGAVAVGPGAHPQLDCSRCPLWGQ